jgi:hypothetical protein
MPLNVQATAWLTGGDAEMIDTLPAATLASFAVLFPYGPNLGAHGGPGRQTPQAWTAAQPQPKWVIFFPGANPAQALAYARAVGAVGVAVDIEPGVEQDAWTLSVAASFGDYMIANGMPVAVYSHEATCAKLAAHFTAQWWDGQAKPATLPSRVAVQYGQQTASNGVIFDLDACDIYFVNLDPPAPSPDPPEAEMRQIIFSATVVNQVPSGPPPGSVVDCISDGTWFRWIETPAVQADIQNIVGPLFNGQPVAVWGTLGQPVADLSCFGRPQDQITATALGLPFGPTPVAPSALTPDQAASLAAIQAGVSNINAKVSADLH